MLVWTKHLNPILRYQYCVIRGPENDFETGMKFLCESYPELTRRFTCSDAIRDSTSHA